MCKEVDPFLPWGAMGEGEGENARLDGDADNFSAEEGHGEC